MVLRTAPKIPKSRNPEIQKSRNPEIPKPRNPEIAKSQDPEPPKSRSPEIQKSASRSGPLNPCMQCSLSAQISCASEVCFALWTGQPVQKNESDVKAQRRLPLQCQVRNHVRKGCSKMQSTKSLNSGSLNPCMYMHGFTLVYICMYKRLRGTGHI